MRRGVDAEGETRDDRQARLTKRPGKAFRVALALGRRVAATHYRQRGSTQQVESAVGVEQGGGISDLQQKPRIGLIGEGNDCVAWLRCPRARLSDCGGNSSRIKGFQRRTGGETRQLGTRSGEDLFRQAVLLEELANGDRAEAWRKR